MGSGEEKTCVKGVAGGLGQAGWWLVNLARWWLADYMDPHLSADKPGGTSRRETDCTTQGSSMGK